VTAVHVVVPDGIDDPARPSGGNAYDRRICQGLGAAGWSVSEHVVEGFWRQPDRAARSALAGLLAGLADGTTVLLDGLIASTAPEVLVPEADRLRLVVLVHMLLGDLFGDAGEATALSAAAAVVTTSNWTRRRLLDAYGLPPARVHVAEPGVDRAGLAPGTPAGGQLLCVAAVIPGKGHDVLFAALATVADLRWQCLCVGSLERDPDFVDRIAGQVKASGIDDRIQLAGARTGSDLASAYAAADVLILASRAETYGMVVTEALAYGLPVIATAVGGLPETLGRVAAGRRPGLLVARGDVAALGTALRGWLSDADLRTGLRQAAYERRPTLSGWSDTSARIARVLTEVAA
jgi:glycosyltransferase involved in cell wall biosynthesis